MIEVNPVMRVLSPLAEGLTRARAQGYHIKHQQQIGMSYTELSLKNLPQRVRSTEMDKAYAAGYWRKLCRFDNRPCVYGEWQPYMNNMEGLLRINIPANKNTQPIMAWVSMAASAGEYYCFVDAEKPAIYTRAVTYVSLRISNKALNTLWSGPQGFVELAKTEWKEILKPLA